MPSGSLWGQSQHRGAGLRVTWDFAFLSQLPLGETHDLGENGLTLSTQPIFQPHYPLSLYDVELPVWDLLDIPSCMELAEIG